MDLLQLELKMKVAKLRKLRAYAEYQKLKMAFLEAEHDYLQAKLDQLEDKA